MPSMWPLTKCPPSRPFTASARSRFTGLPGRSSPRLVRASVSGPAWKANVSPSTATTVRQQPLTQMLSPTAVSAAIRGSRTISRQPGGSGRSSATVTKGLNDAGEHTESNLR